MGPSLTDALCTHCALCCDGSLFADVELASRAEATGLEILGLEVEEDDTSGGLLMQPCTALQGKRCGIYAHRPACCRSFECRLLQETRSGVTSVEQATAHIRGAQQRIGRVQELLIRLGQRDERLPLGERCAEVLATERAATPERATLRAELEAAMTDVERVIRTTFLRGGR